MPDSSARPVVPSSILRAGCGAAALIVATLSGAAHAQPYRHVAADGRVTYSDIPPAGIAASPRAAAGSRQPVASAAASGRATASDEDAPGADGRLAALPYAVRSAASRHPVVLYTSADCAPCMEARTHLSRRGIPFTERQVSTGADVTALRQRGFAGDGFPAVSIGAQRLTGFDAGAWGRLLDAAGYPKISALPSGWRAPAARPLGNGAGGQAAAGSASGATLAGGTSDTRPAMSAPQPVAPTASTAAPAAASAPMPASTVVGDSTGFRF